MPNETTIFSLLLFINKSSHREAPPPTGSRSPRYITKSLVFITLRIIFNEKNKLVYWLTMARQLSEMKHLHC